MSNDNLVILRQTINDLKNLLAPEKGAEEYSMGYYQKLLHGLDLLSSGSINYKAFQKDYISQINNDVEDDWASCKDYKKVAQGNIISNLVIIKFSLNKIFHG